MSIRNLEVAPLLARMKFWNIGDTHNLAQYEKGPDLLNNVALSALNAAGTAAVDMLKVNASDAVEVPTDFKVTGNLVVTGTSTTGSDISAGTVGADLLFTTNVKLEFRATTQYINSPSAGKLAIVATAAGADDIQLTGGVNITGTLAVSGAVALAAAATLATDKKLQLRDTATFLHSPAAGKLALTATVAGADDITITGSITLTGAIAASLKITSAVGIQARAVAVTATVDGATTGIIPVDASVVTVTSSVNTKLVTLPTPTPGVVVVLNAEATGYQLQSSTPASVAINGGTGASAKSAVSAKTLVCRCVSATAWVVSAYVADGTESALAAAA